MKLVVSGGGEQVIGDVQSLVIYDEQEPELPIAACWQRPDGTIGMTHADEPDFKTLLSDLGLDIKVRKITLS